MNDDEQWRRWSPAAQERALLGLQRLTDKPWKPFYCDKVACNGKPHGKWDFPHGRADQHPPGGDDWLTWLVAGGRGAGKTTTGSRWTNRITKWSPRIALIAPTGPDARDTMIEGEALALDTLVPSPDGWTTMGALRAGDQVFAGDGSVCRVIEAFPVLTNRPCYRMTIEGAEVIADARHKWVTSTRDERGYVGRDGYPKERYEQVRTTEDIAKDLKCNGLWPSTNHAIRAVSITGSGSDNLPVPAYTLGYWLGDGSSRSAHITSHPEDQPFIVERIAEDGYETRLSLGQDRRGYTFLVKRLSRDLRAADVIKNKRIPDEYFWASQEQRLALVQGLMDSDGTISERGQFEFSNKNPRLISGMVALLSSLGVKCRVVWRPSGQARVRGTTNLPIFSLPRKSERIPAHRTERDWRYIQNVESVDTVDVRCIKVDSEDNTFLVTEHFIRTHNSGVLATAAPGQRPEWEPSKKKLTWPNGAIGHAFSGEEPDRLRGPQHSAAWVDEPAHIPLIEDVWSNLLFGLRVGQHPHICATTTPLPTKWMKAIVADPTTRLVRASTYANIDNLPPHFAKIILERYENTRLGRQEIHGEILADVEGALWQYEMFDGDQRIDIAPFDLDRVVVGVDPAGTARSKSDETGIVVVGFKDERFYVLADLSGKYSPKGWADQAKRAYDQYSADCVVVETNYGGDMVRATLENADVTMRIEEVTSRRGKVIRADPIVALYERGKVFHLSHGLGELEDQLVSWVPGSSSPDRLDALVHAMHSVAKIVEPASVASPTELRSILSSGHNGLRGATLRQLGVVNQ